MASSDGSITVSPGIPGYATTRAKQLALASRSAYLAILLHNYLHGPPQALPVVERPARVVKVRMQLTISRSLRNAAGKAAARWKMSLSELVEALVIYEAQREEESLTIALPRGFEKPTLRQHK